jgi:hypothetical protein
LYAEGSLIVIIVKVRASNWHSSLLQKGWLPQACSMLARRGEASGSQTRRWAHQANPFLEH